MNQETLDLSGSNFLKQGNASRQSNSKMNNPQQLDPSKIGDYIDYEQQCIRDQNFKEAEIATQRIKELQQHDLTYRSLAVVEKNKQELQELEKLNLQQFNEFNQIWDQIIEEHVENLKQIEDNLILQHQREQEEFEDEIQKLEIPKVKYSKDVINMKYVFENYIKAKKYPEAEDLKKKIRIQEEKEQEKWELQYLEKYGKKRNQLKSKQRQELEAIKVKLENSLQEKVKVRTQELEKLLQKFQNMKNELEVKQNQELSKLQVMNNKTLLKISTNNPSQGSFYANANNSSLDISRRYQEYPFKCKKKILKKQLYISPNVY
ncbi:hypothetical protein PPERSA_00798 [Pseudocohnilembus persalinus]|uniref:Uncharacterized protein n=1 Tax=Pseudocohnilembus persalinus TaxID=266149 RepID=A0A0V0QFU7_PSEPJ|nr:hypothetical protein PPERSA_00798 [Pseudocohnilembus persalinus]|eukprot:KRX01050.1 hypothetical protein PPERSA_00798 [Pseudocohnilembus persalinus]